MTEYLIEVSWSDEDQGFIAIVPDLPGCSAFGETATEAVRELEDAQVAWIEACRVSWRPDPVADHNGTTSGLAADRIRSDHY